MFDKITKGVEFLRGKKTYIIGSIGILVLVANGLGFIDDETTMTILTALGAGSLFTLRAAISSLGSK